MYDEKGQFVLCTPSVLYAENSAVAGLDAGENGLITIKHTDWESSDTAVDRKVWEWRIYDEDHHEIGSDDDLRSPEFHDALQAMGAIISFLTACAEASEDGENYNLFTPIVRDWASRNSDELAMIAVEIEQEEELRIARGGSLGKAH